MVEASGIKPQTPKGALDSLKNKFPHRHKEYQYFSSWLAIN
jgi:hypothetical protein